MSVLHQKKEKKRNSLLEAAHELFLERGQEATSVDSIVERARMAKGTFYLYFKNKDALLSEVIYRLGRNFVLEAAAAEDVRAEQDFVEKLLLLLEHVIEHFKENPAELRMMEKNFSWSLIREKLQSAEEDAPLLEKLNAWVQSPCLAKYSREESLRILYAIFEMFGSLCYSCIIEHQPVDIDEMKGTLFLLIRKMLA